MISMQSASIVAASTATLFLKGLVLSYVQVAARYRARSFSRPEDAKLLGLAPQSEPDLAVRAAGALRNEAENTPFFLTLAIAYVLLGGPPSQLFAVASLYVSARLYQGYAQIRALQPQRMIGFLAGVVATLCLVTLTALQIGS
jgi:uncharacterized MAPEG superfamily protein